MAIYEYKAIDKAKKVRKGIIDADSPREARIKLRRDSLFVTTLKETKERGTRALRIRGITGVDTPNRVRSEQVAAVTRQMASLLQAGIPLAEGIRMVI